MRPTPTSVAYVLDPRFPGGTSTAVAAELRALAGHVRLEVYALTGGMFPGRPVADALERAFLDLGLTPRWDPPQVAADVVVIPNPSFLKFDTVFAPRIVARDLIVATHENLTRPGGWEAFDVAHCLALIDRGSLALVKHLAPVSAVNRATVKDWLAVNRGFAHWSVLPADWHNICDFDLVPPTATPADRRGRHSRPGFEKFPALADLDLCFPAAAETVILGADSLIAAGVQRPHWRMIPFQGIPVEAYFDMIDFLVFFPARNRQESFGRVLAEGIAAGKVVICDKASAEAFGPGPIAADPEDVDGIVHRLVASPRDYAAQVRMAQAALARFAPAAFRAAHAGLLGLTRRACA